MTLDDAVKLIAKHGNVSHSTEMLLTTKPTRRQLEEARIKCHWAINDAFQLIAKHHGIKLEEEV